MTDYYQEHSWEYFERTIDIDPTAFLEPIAGRLPHGATVLDVGCGSGRDLIWMKGRGFRPTGFERSRGLVAMAQEASGCEVIEGDFETYDFSRHSVDAVLLITSLVHLPHDRLVGVLHNIARALTPGGWMLISLKEGSGISTDSRGRTFYLWQAPDLERQVRHLGFKVVESSSKRSALDTGEAIINVLLQYRMHE